MTIIKAIILKLCDFAYDIKLFQSGQQIGANINIRQINNYSILMYTFEYEKYLITLVSMKHINSENFETTKLFSEIRKDEMYIVNGDAYMIDQELHCDIYDKSDFFNMSISGELVSDFDYEFYELFNDLREFRKNLNINSVELQIKVKNEGK